MTALVQVRNLSIAFATEAGPALALRDVSFDIPAGGIVGLVGESGSGKSTLAHALMNILPANARIVGGTIARTDPAATGAIVFQDPMTALNPVFTVGSQMVDAQRARFPGRSRAEARQRAAAMLARVGIPDAGRRLAAYPHQFSGGMRQRIMIAMALLAEPRLLIADEPTTALDVTVEAQIAALIRTLQAELGFAVLFVSHSLGLVAELCETVHVLYAGTLVEQGPTAQVFARPRHPYTAALLACEPVPGEDPASPLQSIAGEVPRSADAVAGCIFTPRCPVRIGRCASDRPPLRDQRGGQSAACWLA